MKYDHTVEARYETEDAVPARPSMIDESLTDLHESIGGLELLINVLQKKIDPVLKPAGDLADASEAVKGENDPASKVTVSITDANQRLFIIRRRLDKMIQRVEL